MPAKMMRTGFSVNAVTDIAMKDAVRNACPDGIADLGAIVVFAGGQHRKDAIAEAIGRLRPDAPVIGGSAVGGIGSGQLGYSGYEVVVAALPKEQTAYQVLTADGIDERGEFDTGIDLGRKLHRATKDGQSVIVFFDSVSVAENRRTVYSASRLIAGIYQGLSGRVLKLGGAGMLSDFNFSDSWLLAEGRARKGIAAALILPSSLDVRFSIFHGCRPVSTYFEITRIEGTLLYELDGKPAMDVLRGFAPPGFMTDERALTLRFCLGLNCGSPYGWFDETAYVNRLVVGLVPEKKAVRLLDCDFKQGMRVQIMSRDSKMVLDSTREGMESVRRGIDMERMFGAFYFNCAGRANALSALPVEDASVVQEKLAGLVPFAGLYCGIEVAPVLGPSRPLDWTGVLGVLERR